MLQVSINLPSSKGLSYMPIMDYHSSHITRKLTQTITHVQQTEDLSSSAAGETQRPTTGISTCSRCISR